MVTAIEPAQLTRQERKEMDFFGYFTEGVIVLRGPAGSGKTMNLVAIAYNLKKYYGKSIILDFHPKADFGEYTYMDSEKFIEELKKIGKIAKDDKTGIERVANEVREKLGIQFDNAVIAWDEAYKYLDSRRPGDSLVLTYGYYLQMWRHYHSTVIMCTPRFDMIDAKRGLNQVTIELTCSANFRVTPTRVYGLKNPKDWICTARGVDRFTLETVRIETPAVKYGQFFDSWVPIGLRTSLLKKVQL